MVGGDAELAGVGKAAGELHDVGRGDHSSLVVSLLGPRVRKVDVEGRDRAVSDAACDEISRVGPENSDVGHVPASHAVDTVFIEFVGPLDAQVVELGVCLGLIEQKGAFSGADLDVQGCGALEEALEVGPFGEFLDIHSYVFVCEFHLVVSAVGSGLVFWFGCM